MARIDNPIQLDPAFPLAWYHFRQADRAITWLHRHDCLELGYCHDGRGLFVVEDKVFPFAGGSVSVISRHEMHLASSAPGTTSRWTFISLDPPRLLPGADPTITTTADLAGADFANLVDRSDATLTALLQELVAELDRAQEAWQDAARALVWRLMVHLHRHHAVARPVAPSSLDPIAPALAILGHRHQEELDVPQLARACGLSESHFRRRFTACLGIGPKAYLDRLRVEMACALLDDPARSVTDVALEVGFGSISAFNRRFKAIMGVAPRAWRRRTAGS